MIAWLALGMVVTWLVAAIDCLFIHWFPRLPYRPAFDGALGRPVAHYTNLGMWSFPPGTAGIFRGLPKEVLEASFPQGIAAESEWLAGAPSWAEFWQVRLASSRTRFELPSDHSDFPEVAVWTDVVALRFGWPRGCWASWYVTPAGHARFRSLPYWAPSPKDTAWLGIPAGHYEQGPDGGTPGLYISPRLLPIVPTFHLLLPASAAYALSLWLLLRGPRLGLRCYRRRQGRCPYCGYSRAGLPTPATPCPECGRANTLFVPHP